LRGVKTVASEACKAAGTCPVGVMEAAVCCSIMARAATPSTSPCARASLTRKNNCNAHNNSTAANTTRAGFSHAPPACTSPLTDA